VNKDKLEMEYCNTEIQLADILTKPMAKARFDTLKKLIGMNAWKTCLRRCVELISHVLRKQSFRSCDTSEAEKTSEARTCFLNSCHS
jgi:hypothetical protein